MVELPNADRLKQLPLRAMVAYAVRCAMRVQTLFLKWQDGKAESGPPAGMAESVAEAIELASRFAADSGEYDLQRGQELEEIVIEAVMRAKNGHRGAAFAANAAYAALNAANIAFAAEDSAANRREEADKVVQAVTTAADAAAAAHEPAVQSAIDDWHALQLMRNGEYPEAGKAVDPSPEGKLGPLFKKKESEKSWKDESPTLRQLKRNESVLKKNENLLEQTRQELIIQQEERKKDQAAHEAKCDEYDKTIRHLKAEVIPLKREKEELTKELEACQEELEALKNQLQAQAEDHRNRLTEFANQLIEFAKEEPEAEPAPEPQSAIEKLVSKTQNAAEASSDNDEAAEKEEQAELQEVGQENTD